MLGVGFGICRGIGLAGLVTNLVSCIGAGTLGARLGICFGAGFGTELVSLALELGLAHSLALVLVS